MKYARRIVALLGLLPLVVAPLAQAAVKGDITVLAAASLTESFTEIGKART